MKEAIGKAQMKKGYLEEVINGFNDNFERIHKLLLYYIDKCDSLEKRIDQLEKSNV